MNYYSEEIKADISKSYIEGMNISSLAEKYNLNKEIIRYILKKTGVYIPVRKTPERWTDDEKERLKEYYAKYDFKTIEKLLPNHTHASIVHVCYDMRLNRKVYRKSLKENKHKEIYDKPVILPKRELLDKTSKVEITYPKPKRNCKPRPDWYTQKEMDFIVNHYKTMSDEDIGKVINRTPKSVQAKRLQLGIKKQGISSYNLLSEFVRRNNFKWKNESMKNCNYKCVITGNRFDEIHHIVGLNYILDISLKELGYDLVYDTRYYTDEELCTILNKFREVQGRYPLGVCLTKDIHTKFHSIYGFGNNTLEQWEKFKNNQLKNK